MTTLKAVRGTRDLLPPETALWNRIETTARAVFARYKFGEIRTPIFEDTSLFARGVGEETDIVSKEMFTWWDRERFDKQALRRSWETSYRHAWPRIEPLPDEESDADMVFRDPDNERFILISFAERATTVTKQSLEYIVSADRQRRGTDNIYGLLVYPAGSGSEYSHVDGTTMINEWPVTGNFFASGQSLTLRPENTAGVVRAYIEHKLGESGQLQKLFYIGPQFRRERPQRGRYRQFFQIGAEVIGPPSAGSESPLRDAEVLEMLASLLDELGITGWTLELNSVGSPADRARYNETLRAALIPVVGQMCQDCQRRAETNPLRVLDCKVPEDQPIIATLPVIADSLDEDSKTHFAAVTAALDAAGVPYTRNHRLVRGLDYYTRTTFEFTHGGLPPHGASSAGTPVLGAQNALLGGGRYDGLSEAIGGPRAPGIGFAMGEDRLVLTLLAQEAAKNAAQDAAQSFASKVDAFIAPLGESLNAPALALARELRRAGLAIELGDGSFRLKKSFEAADKTARAIVILGEDELKSGILTVKTFATGVQTKVPRAELAGFLANPAPE